jgi:hypothetical protein
MDGYGYARFIRVKDFLRTVFLDILLTTRSILLQCIIFQANNEDNTTTLCGNRLDVFAYTSLFLDSLGS